MRTGTNVSPQINTPQLRPVPLVCIQQYISRETTVRVILRIGGIPFQHHFQFSVAVQIRHRGIVGRICAHRAIGHRDGSRHRQRNLYIPHRRLCGQYPPSGKAGRTTLPTGHGPHLVTGCRIGRIIIIKQGGSPHRFTADPPAVAIHMKSRLWRIGGQITPAYRYRIRRSANGHYAPVERLHLHVCQPIAGLRYQRKHPRHTQQKSHHP